MDENLSKRRNYYLGPAVAIILIALLGSSLVYFRHNSPYGVATGLSGTPAFLLRLTGVEIVGRSDGKRIWSLKTSQVDVSQTRIRTEFEAITDGKLYEGDRVAATITAGRGSYDSISGDVRVWDGVKIRSQQGYGATADSASWSAYLKRLVCPGKVAVTGKDSRVEGQNLVVDVRQAELRMEKPKLTISVSDVPEVAEITKLPQLGGKL